MGLSPHTESGQRLREHVETLAVEIGERTVYRPGSLEAAADYIEERFRGTGLPVTRQEFAAAGRRVHNIVATRSGTEPGIRGLVIGAHYDSVVGSPGANDNATGVAALLELARSLAERSVRRTVSLVAFVNEEPPFFRTPLMGSRVYARSLSAARTRLTGMISLETIGYFDSRAGSQRYPPPFRAFYPDRGEFIGIVANLRSTALARRCAAAFRRHSTFPLEWVAAPGWVPGLGWSDHWSFWRHGYPGVMVTDTAPFRYPWYHTAGDTPDKICFPEFTGVVAGLRAMTLDLIGASS